MKKIKMRTPFFVVNPKSYLFGNEILELAVACDKLAAKYDIDFLFTAQHVDLYRIAQATSHLIVTAQHMDGINPGRGMGRILPEGLRAAGVQATFLNHAEHPLSTEELTKSIVKADDLGILTIVCANSIKEAQAVAALNPDVIVCEPTELIGSGQSSDISYMKATNEAIRAMDSEVYILQAAGISSGADIEKALESGADASGGTSGIVAADNPIAVVEEMLQVLASWKEGMK
ncbi:MAG: triose-phosphate isomerase [Streptococcaceae bacterium]|jgi:triosephosphate isomerase|nr:triose-phosphate isomerase [Streptococcaceae bacterium]